jgi:hypothetical protein
MPKQKHPAREGDEAARKGECGDVEKHGSRLDIVAMPAD